MALSAIRSTYIDASGVWTPNVYAEHIVGNIISGKQFSNTGHTGWLTADQSDGNVADFNFHVSTTTVPLFTLYNGIDSLIMKSLGDEFLSYSGSVHKALPLGTWDFSGVNVTLPSSVNVIAKFG